ncbi:TCP-1/cpn60 chaperonin family protein [Chlamydiifrater phoenicopteri]|uniref:TCP-1/cpn60 chaperonin family protein n=1 Tax=Chlamydiifrater phoenicopteri TaxID=2681469 RepID=UPI001BCB6E73|nr:TCP-1/cpn60 chaperonin family protein [Chlamydiifrater phoenicopteri]
MFPGKNLAFGKDAANKLLSGISKLSLLLAPHIGPETASRASIISLHKGCLSEEHVERLALTNDFEIAGAEMALSLGDSVSATTGGGGIASILLLETILKESLEAIQNGAITEQIIEGLYLGVQQIETELSQKVTPVKDLDKIKALALCSSRGNDLAAKAIHTAFSSVFPSGFILVESSTEQRPTLNNTHGLRLSIGFSSPYFISDTSSMSVSMSNPYILIINAKISDLHPFLPLFKKISETDRDLLIICESISSQTLSSLIINRIKNLLRVCVVSPKNPCSFFREELEDAALFSGTFIIRQENLPSLCIKTLGRCDQARIFSNKLILIGSNVQPDLHALQIKRLEENIKHSANEQEKVFLMRRKKRLSEKVAFIDVFSTEKRSSLDFEASVKESILSVETALESGFVPGGGTSLFYASTSLENLSKNQSDNSVKSGIQALQRACFIPMSQIISNSGFKPEVVIEKLLVLKNPVMGLNGSSEQIEDLIAAGILDPYRTVMETLRHSVDLASLILRSAAVISKK